MGYSEESDELNLREKDINYRLVLIEKQKRDREQEKGKAKKAAVKRPRSKTTTRSSKKKKQESSEECVEDDRPESEIEEDEDDGQVTSYLDQAQREEQSRIDQLIVQKRQDEAERKDILLEYAHRGLVTGCTIVDREFGYDGSFGEVISQDPLAAKLLKHKIYCSDSSKRYYSMVTSYGLWAYIGMKYIETHPGLLGGLFENILASPENLLPPEKIQEENAVNNVQ
jgi:hypothetical protein